MSERSDMTAILVQVARLYYLEGLSQLQIAERLRVSRSLIALYLQRAREQGIVRIEIVNPQDTVVELALELVERTGIKHITVVPSSFMSQSNALTAHALASTAAHLLKTCLQDGDVLGIGWGRTMAQVTALLPPSRFRDLVVVPLLGETTVINSFTQANQMVLQVAQAFGAQPYFLLAPLLVGTRKLRDALMEDEVVHQATGYWDKLDVVCYGIGVVPPTPGMIVYIGADHLPKLEERGAVGDICARYFDPRGQWIPTGLDDRMIAVTTEQLRRARRSMGVAWGVEKAQTVHAAILTGIMTDLIIDEDLAKALLAFMSLPTNG
ncbi:MAG: sugar-binding transcriptional regulator [Anaerolineae bacterium]|nr:sugar-binding transcriptional regulator [Anaerolineae bacterium]